MAEEKEEVKVNEVDPNQNYLETIKKLKETTVAKEDYEKVMEDNRKLLDSLVNGTGADKKEADPEPVDIDTLRNDLFNKENNNLEYAKKSLALRDALIEQGENDPFLPAGHKIVATEEDKAAADRVAEALKHCIDYAEGDSELFTNELQRIMVDVSPMIKRR